MATTESELEEPPRAFEDVVADRRSVHDYLFRGESPIVAGGRESDTSLTIPAIADRDSHGHFHSALRTV